MGRHLAYQWQHYYTGLSPDISGKLALPLLKVVVSTLVSEYTGLGGCFQWGRTGRGTGNA